MYKLLPARPDACGMTTVEDVCVRSTCHSEGICLAAFGLMSVQPDAYGMTSVGKNLIGLYS